MKAETTDGGYMDNVGTRLKAARERAKMTQQELANRLGLKTHAFIANVEAGRKALPTEQALRVAEILAMPLRDLLDPDDLPPDLLEGLEYLLEADPEDRPGLLETMKVWVRTRKRRPPPSGE